MKKLFFIFIVLLLFFIPSIVSAERLVCDIPSNQFNACEVEVNGVTQVDGSGNSLCSMDNGPDGPVMLIYHSDEDNKDYMELLAESIMAGLSPGQQNFRARIKHPSGWWGDWSSFLSAEKPGILGNVQVVE